MAERRPVLWHGDDLAPGIPPAQNGDRWNRLHDDNCWCRNESGVVIARFLTDAEIENNSVGDLNLLISPGPTGPFKPEGLPS